MKISNIGKNSSQLRDVISDDTDVDLTFSTSELMGPRLSPLIEAALGSRAFEAANDTSSFSKRPERVRTFRSVTPPGEPGVVRHEHGGEE